MMSPLSFLLLIICAFFSLSPNQPHYRFVSSFDLPKSSILGFIYKKTTGNNILNGERLNGFSIYGTMSSKRKVFPPPFQLEYLFSCFSILARTSRKTLN